MTGTVGVRMGVTEVPGFLGLVSNEGSSCSGLLFLIL